MSESKVARETPKAGRKRTGSTYQVAGVWTIRITLPDGSRSKPIPLPGYSEAKAREKALALTELAARGEGTREGRREAVKGPARTVAALVERWLPLIEQGDLAAATKRAHASHARGAISERFGAVRPEEVVTPMLREWLRSLKSKLSASRVRNIFFTLSKMLDDGRAEGWVTVSNPCRDDKVRDEVPAMGEPDDDAKVRHTEAEASQLIRSTTAPERRLRYLVAFSSLMRDGEIAGLRWLDLDNEKGVEVYRIRGAVACWGDEGAATRRKPKSKASKRLVPIHPLALAELTRWRAEGWRAHVGRDPKPDDPVFPSKSGTPFRPPSALLFRKDLVAAGMAPDFADDEGTTEAFDFRSTRRSGATWLTAHDVSASVADRLMGHAAQSVREKHYAASDLGLMARAIETITLDLASPAPPGDTCNPDSSGESSRPDQGGPPTEGTSERNKEEISEVRTGFEPAYNGFANRCLTTWLPHRRYRRAAFFPRSRVTCQPRWPHRPWLGWHRRREMGRTDSLRRHRERHSIQPLCQSASGRVT